MRCKHNLRLPQQLPAGGVSRTACAHYGIHYRDDVGPLWAHKGPYLFKELIILMKNHRIINKNIKIVNLEILKVKTWFGDKDLFS